MGPEDIELGDEPVQVERRSRAGIVLSVRLAPDEAAKLQALARHRQVPLSTVAREAIETYLNDGPLADPAVSPWMVASVSGRFSVAYQRLGVTARTEGTHAPRPRYSILN